MCLRCATDIVSLRDIHRHTNRSAEAELSLPHRLIVNDTLHFDCFHWFFSRVMTDMIETRVELENSDAPIYMTRLSQLGVD